MAEKRKTKTSTELKTRYNQKTYSEDKTNTADIYLYNK